MYFKELIVPNNVIVEISGNLVKVSGPKGNIEKKLQFGKELKIEKVENKVKVFSENEDRKTKALIGTMAAHIRNMIEGVVKGYVYKLKVVYSHFPITVKLDGEKILIQNFLGERSPRITKIVGKTQVKIEGQDIIVSGIDIDEVSQTAGNIELATRIVGFDRRRFMDGIFLVSRE